MGILSQPELWEDGFAGVPPFQWEALETDDRYYFDNTIGSVTTQGGIFYVGDEPYPSTIVFEWEVLVPPTHGNILFYWHTDGYAAIEECEFEVLDVEAGSGTITLTPDESWGQLYWGIWPQEVTLSPYTYASIVAIGEGEEPTVETTEGQYYKVEYLPVDEFVAMCNSRVTTSDDVVVTNYGPDNVQITIVTDRPPTYWTSINDEYVLFDSYDSEVESNIIADKTQVFVDKSPSIILEDDHVINLPANLMPYLERQVEAYCMAVIKQQPSLKSEQLERRLRVRQQRNKWRHQRLNKNGPNFGR